MFLGLLCQRVERLTCCQLDARTAALRVQRARFKFRRHSKLASDSVLFGVVQHFLAQGWSPAQIAGTLKLMWPDESQRTVSHETIYNCIYAMPKGELRKDLIACLRRAKAKRMPRSRGEDRRGQMPDLLSILARRWLHPGSVVVADNVLFPGSPKYRAYMRTSAQFDTVEHRTHAEYTRIPDLVLESTYLG